MKMWASSVGFLRSRYTHTRRHAPLKFSRTLLSAARQRMALSVLVMLLVVTGCRFSLDELRYMKLEGKDFTTSLAREYRLLAQRKAARAGWWDADYFAEKGLRSAHGVTVDPEHPEDWKVPPALLEPLQEARRALLDTVTGTAITLSPEAAARAYALYDCWVMETENKATTVLMESCRTEFFDTLNYISVTKQAVPEGKVLDYGKVPQEKPASIANGKKTLETKKPKAEKPVKEKAEPAKKLEEAKTVSVPRIDPYAMPEKMPLTMPATSPKSLAYRAGGVPMDGEAVAPRNYLILFGPSSAKLPPEAGGVVEHVLQDLKDVAAYEVILNGHADATEEAEDVMRLSRRRAEAVKDALVQKGVDKERIQLYGFGDSDPAATAAEGKQQPENRRVQVFIQ